MSDFEQICRDWLTVPPSTAERGVRRCVEGHLDRSLPRACAVCGGATVGLALDRVYSGEEDLLARDVARREKARGIVLTGLAGVWVLVALRVLVNLVTDGVVHALVVLVTSSVFALVVQAVVALVARTLLDAVRGRATHGAHVEELPTKLALLSERILEPFLARNGVGENMPVRVPPDELALLEQTFAQEGLVPRHGSLVFLATAGALRRDLRRLRERLVGSGAGDWFLAYARTTPDERLLPLLEEVLFEEGLDPEGAAEQVRARRSEKTLETFRADLEQRRTTEAVVVTVETLDLVEPASFEALVAMVLELDGYVRSGAPLERHGEKLAAVIRQGGGALLDTAVVQEALVARTELGSARALIATNAAFSDAARELARANRVELIDRDALRARLESFNRSPGDHARVAALLRPRSA